MNVTEYNSVMNELGIDGPGINSTTKKELKWKDGSVTPINTRVHIDFSNKLHGRIFVTIGDKVYKTRVDTASKRFTGITNPPQIWTMEKWSNDGIAKTVTGMKTEPDGFGLDGSPSWLLVIGVI